MDTPSPISASVPFGFFSALNTLPDGFALPRAACAAAAG